MKKERKMSAMLANASGKIEITLKNDLMFHMVMARSGEALKDLICSLKGWSPDKVKSAVLLNTVDVNEDVTKEVILDVRVELNSNEILVIELQIQSFPYWENRSILYLCRSFDNLNGAETGYDRIKPTTMVCIMDHDLFPEYPEFYARYMLKNIRNNNIYSSNFCMNVLSLNQTLLATDEDVKHGLVRWAEVFNAGTWEELVTLAGKDDIILEVAEMMYTIDADEHTRSLLRARKMYRETQATLENELNRTIVDLEIEKKRADSEKERADNEKERADTEKKRADSEKERADNEKERADTEKKRANDAEARADSEEKRVKMLEDLLRAHDIDPDSV